MNTLIEYPVNEEGAKDLINRIHYSESWLGFLCAKIGLTNVNADGYGIHFHSWGRLRWWKRQWIFEAYGLSRMTVLKKQHVTHLLITHPSTMYEAMKILRTEYPNHQFTFMPSRHS